MSTHLISKSRFVSGTQCLKKLYFDKHRRDQKPDPDFGQEALFQQGTTVGELAQQCFPGGVDLSPENYYDYLGVAQQTLEEISSGREVIYEAAFLKEKVLAALDILVIQNGEIHAIEVKSSTSVKDYHLTDASLQYWVMEKCGVKPDKFFIMYLNNKYIRGKKLEVKELFILEDITAKVLERQASIVDKLAEMMAMLEQAREPEVDIGAHCGNPFSCDYRHHCWKHIPSNSIFEVARIGAKSWDLYRQGIISLDDISDDNIFSDAQIRQLNSYRKNEELIDRDSIKTWLGELIYPLYYFDFETLWPGIPIYPNSSPYQQIPVQFSLHIQEVAGGEVVHKEFLAGFDNDPREELILHMLRLFGDKGNIVVFNQSFESSRIQELAALFPQYAPALHQIQNRMVDLIIPFRSGWYYHPHMKGSNSIKSVYPAICPEKAGAYSSLNIGNGGDASVYLQAMAEGTLAEDKKEIIRQQLLEYCQLDTLAMVHIVERLYGYSIGLKRNPKV